LAYHLIYFEMLEQLDEVDEYIEIVEDELWLMVELVLLDLEVV